ncbi:hypothetical protein [Celerinatantimonas sp. YJH-8]|uniref:hypothetical protein n=1 Tax=Celerinatantimonas sp. YJH-8 TaxID=3228714 RepID=UPI0038C4A138
MFGYIGLAFLLTVIVPGLCYLAGCIDLYLRFGAHLSGIVLLLWVLIDAMKMRYGRVHVKHVHLKKKHHS